MQRHDTLSTPNIEAWLRAMAQAFEDNMARLSALDADLGDGDHGSSMARAFRAVVAKLDAGAQAQDCSPLLQMAGMTLVSVSGGATGPLFGTIFLEAAKTVKGKSALGLSDVAALFAAASTAVMARGGARPGEKTMIDALEPAAQALRQAVEAGLDLAGGLDLAAVAARTGAQATAAMLATKGRARYLGQRSLGHEDAGAHSVALMLAALAAVAAAEPAR